jgi:hypothetical protein
MVGSTRLPLGFYPGDAFLHISLAAGFAGGRRQVAKPREKFKSRFQEIG